MISGIRMIKKIIIIFSVIALISAVVVINKDRMIKAAVVAGVKKFLNTDVKVGSLKVSLLKQKILIRDLVIYNLPGSLKEPFFDIPKVDIDFDLASLLKNKLYLRQLQIELKGVFVVKGWGGKLNIDALGLTRKGECTILPLAAKPIQIDRLTLSLEKIVYKDLSQSGNPEVTTFDINMKDRVYENVTDWPRVIGLILMEVFTRIASSGVLKL